MPLDVFNVWTSRLDLTAWVRFALFGSLKPTPIRRSDFEAMKVGFLGWCSR
jgi:hypothetical protein